MPPKGSRSTRSDKKGARIEAPAVTSVQPTQPGRRTRAQSVAKLEVVIKQEKFSDDEDHGVEYKAESFETKTKTVAMEPSVKKPTVQPSNRSRTLRSGSVAPKNITATNEMDDELSDLESANNKIEKVKTKNMPAKEEHSDDEEKPANIKVEKDKPAPKYTAGKKQAVKKAPVPAQGRALRSQSVAPKDKALEVFENGNETESAQISDHSTEEEVQQKTAKAQTKKATMGRGRPKFAQIATAKDEEADDNKGESITQKLTGLSLSTLRPRGKAQRAQKDKDAADHVSNSEEENQKASKAEPISIIDTIRKGAKNLLGNGGGAILSNATKGRGRPQAARMKDEDYLHHTAELFEQIRNIAEKGVTGVYNEEYEERLAEIRGLAQEGVGYLEETLGSEEAGTAI